MNDTQRKLERDYTCRWTMTRHRGTRVPRCSTSGSDLLADLRLDSKRHARQRDQQQSGFSRPQFPKAQGQHERQEREHGV